MKKIILVTLDTGLLVVGTSANAAGQGGIAGAVAVHTSAANTLNWSSSSVAIGKSSANAGAVSTTGAAGNAISFAVGTGGSVTLDSTTGLVTAVSEETAAGLALGQANSLTGSSVNLDAGTATDTVVVTVGD